MSFVVKTCFERSADTDFYLPSSLLGKSSYMSICHSFAHDTCSHNLRMISHQLMETRLSWSSWCCLIEVAHSCKQEVLKNEVGFWIHYSSYRKVLTTVNFQCRKRSSWVTCP